MDHLFTVTPLNIREIDFSLVHDAWLNIYSFMSVWHSCCTKCSEIDVAKLIKLQGVSFVYDVRT